MDPLIALSISLKALKANKLRSFLTTLGIIIGVAAVISLVSITQGAKNMIENQLTTLGGNSLIVNSGKRTGSGKKSITGDIKPLTIDDANSIRNLSSVKYVSEIVDTTKNVVAADKTWFTTIVGSSPDFIFINDWLPEKGTFFNYRDIENSELVCVIGKTIETNLFNNLNPVGKNIRIENHNYRVIGVMSYIGQTPSGKDQDDLILIPFTTVQNRLLGTKELDNISLATNSREDINPTEVQIAKVLRQNHNITPGEENDFYIKTQTSQINRILTISKVLSVLLGSIASISLIVGGIGIMNIMLVSVGERTREIGIRMAVGAREKDILSQFLIESIVLSLIGGAIGIAFGIVVSKTSSYFTNWPTEISLSSILIAFVFAALVGIFFGIYPAQKASKLNPIEALRYE